MKRFRAAAPLALALALALTLPASAQDGPAPSPNQIVESARASDWVTIPAEDLLVMTLAPDRDGNERQVVIQLMPPPFSQGWVENIRTLARAGWYDGVSINRVQDNYVVQWGDPNVDNPEAEGEARPLPEGLSMMGEDAYTVGFDKLSTVVSDGTSRRWGSEKVTLTQTLQKILNDPSATKEAKSLASMQLNVMFEFPDTEYIAESKRIADIVIQSTKTDTAINGWHERDSYSEWVEFWNGWPLANFEIAHWEDDNENHILQDDETATKVDRGLYKVIEESWFWPIHCYGMVGVGRSSSPDTGSGAELYTVIGHAPRHLDRNIALVGRVVEGIEHLSSLPRGKGALGFYEDASKRVPIESIRVASDLAGEDQPGFEYLSTDSGVFARYADARANRRDPWFIEPAGGADICNIPVPIRRVGE